MKDPIKEKKYYADLLDYYGRMLTSPQHQIMREYFLSDMSLSEIGEDRHISRTAVLDAIQKASAKLAKYEERLGLMKAIKEVKGRASGETLGIITELESKLKNGI